MINYDTFKAKLSKKNQEIEAQVDEWLEIKVLPFFKGNGQGFDAPKGIPDILDRLKARGFNVTDYSGYQGRSIYFHDTFKD